VDVFSMLKHAGLVVVGLVAAVVIVLVGVVFATVVAVMP
jgi:hypothetical protein